MSCDSNIGTTGRPADYTDDIGLTICCRLVAGESLRAICADPAMPNKATVLDWFARHPEFREQYESALEAQAEDLADEIIEIIDDARGDYVEKVRANGRVVTVFDPDNLARCCLRWDVRRWVVERLVPKSSRFSKQERTETNGRRI